MIGQGRHIKAAILGLVGHQHPDAARDGHQTQPVAFHQRTGFRTGIGDIEHFIDRSGTVNAVLTESRVIDRIRTRQGCRVRLRGLRADRAAPDLHHDHRLALRPRKLQRLDEPVAIRRAFEIAHDHAGIVILRAIGHGIGEIDIAGIARRCPEVDTQPAHPHQRHAIRPEGAALADDRHAAGPGQMCLDPRREGRVKVSADIGDPEAVRTD